MLSRLTLFFGSSPFPALTPTHVFVQLSHTLAMFAARQLLLQHTDLIRLSFFTSAIYAFACALSGVMWWEWVVTGGGNANFVFGVRSVSRPFFHRVRSQTCSSAVPYLWRIREHPPPSCPSTRLLVIRAPSPTPLAGTRCCRRCSHTAGGSKTANQRQEQVQRKSTATDACACPYPSLCGQCKRRSAPSVPFTT